MTVRDVSEHLSGMSSDFTLVPGMTALTPSPRTDYPPRGNAGGSARPACRRCRAANYVGVTSDLLRRVYEHKNGLIAGHTKNYRINKLVHFENYQTARDAIQREKNIKHWPRAWKTKLIAQENPTWRDLYEDIGGK